jgi:hypothetical protein
MAVNLGLMAVAIVVPFLSCLYGSEHMIHPHQKLTQFLSCLYGSEREKPQGNLKFVFLSCLYGSERYAKAVNYNR